MTTQQVKEQPKKPVAAAVASVEESKEEISPTVQKTPTKQQAVKPVEVVAMDHATLNRAYPDVHYPGEGKLEKDNNINVVIIGHVDSGKSTLTGHILYKLGYVSKQSLRKNEKLSETNGKAGFHFAYIMDETEEERQRGVTIEVTTRFFSTQNRDFTILDAPGHRDYIANMICGAANANAAILVIDAVSSAFERGWDGYHATTKEHAILARSQGVSQIIVAINKME